MYVGEFIFALSSACFSGADITLLVDNSDKEKFEKLMSNYVSTLWAGLLFAFLCSSIISCIFDYKDVFWVTLFFNFILVLVACFRNSRKTKVKITSFDIYKNVVKSVKYNRDLKFWGIAYAFIMCVLSTEYLLIQPLFNETNSNTVYNGIIYTIFTLSALISSKIYDKFGARITDKKKLLRLLMIILLLLTASVSVTVFEKHKKILLFIIIFTLYRFIWGIVEVLLEARINYYIENDNGRTTILSIVSLLTNVFASLVLLIISTAKMNMFISYIFLSILIFTFIVFTVRFENNEHGKKM